MEDRRLENKYRVVVCSFCKKNLDYHNVTINLPGTYNNQYMVLDLKQIELKKAVHDNALWVVEQIPGLVAYDDVSMILREGRLKVTIKGNMPVSSN